MPLALVISSEEQSVATAESKSVGLVSLHYFIDICCKKLCLTQSLKLLPFNNLDHIDKALVLPADDFGLIQCCDREHILLRLYTANYLEALGVNHVDDLFLSADKK